MARTSNEPFQRGHRSGDDLGARNGQTFATPTQAPVHLVLRDGVVCTGRSVSAPGIDRRPAGRSPPRSGADQQHRLPPTAAQRRGPNASSTSVRNSPTSPSSSIPPRAGPRLTQGRALAACARSGFVPAPLTEVGETSTHVVFAAAGHGVALVPESVQRLRLDRVVHVPLAETETVSRGLARRQQRNPRATERTAVVVGHMSSGTRQP
ncbi:LysR substrate-binding domain-containing protein [Streptomyces bobili]|uniref:LysR substrate-binding domain-containing protein n=1 Tax=Streptomyces bobili TaxID=67280 RepID=UPI002E2C0B8C|nr:LysR substrate-binding domain-containing protein [Streptomyces bobili]